MINYLIILQHRSIRYCIVHSVYYVENIDFKTFRVGFEKSNRWTTHHHQTRIDEICKYLFYFLFLYITLFVCLCHQMTSLLSLSVRTSYHQHCWKYKKEKENFLNEICFKYTVFIRERKRTNPNSNRHFWKMSRTEPELAFWKFSRTEPNSNRMISVWFVSMVVLSFEKSSYILDQVLWFLLNESLVER